MCVCVCCCLSVQCACVHRPGSVRSVCCAVMMAFSLPPSLPISLSAAMTVVWLHPILWHRMTDYKKWDKMAAMLDDDGSDEVAAHCQLLLVCWTL